MYVCMYYVRMYARMNELMYVCMYERMYVCIKEYMYVNMYA